MTISPVQSPKVMVRSAEFRKTLSRKPYFQLPLFDSEHSEQFEVVDGEAYYAILLHPTISYNPINQAAFAHLAFPSNVPDIQVDQPLALSLEEIETLATQCRRYWGLGDKEFKQIENQANRFASAFLLPEETFLNDLTYPTLDSFWLLKEKWKVSIALMIRRCFDLNIIDEDDYRKLNINLRRRGWHKKEPQDDALEIEKPRFLKRAFDLIVENNVQTRDDIQASLPFPKNIVEELRGAPKGFLSEDKTKIEPFPRLKVDNASHEISGSKAKVISIKEARKK